MFPIARLRPECLIDWLNLQAEYWSGISESARQFVRMCLTVDPTNRPSAGDLLNHDWLKLDEQAFVQDPSRAAGNAVDLLPSVKAGFDAKKTCEYRRRQIVIRNWAHR